MAARAKDPYLSDEWQQLFMEQRAHMARAGVHASLLLNGGAAVALLAFMGHVAGASEGVRYQIEFALIRNAFIAFGVGVFLATATYIFTYFIASLRIHDTFLKKRVEARTIDKMRWMAVAVFVASLMMFLLGMICAVLSVQTR
ncbi:MAG: hypothetical protein WBD48_12075 [Pseudolabrys sp.]